MTFDSTYISSCLLLLQNPFFIRVKGKLKYQVKPKNSLSYESFSWDNEILSIRDETELWILLFSSIIMSAIATFFISNYFSIWICLKLTVPPFFHLLKKVSFYKSKQQKNRKNITYASLVMFVNSFILS